MSVKFSLVPNDQSPSTTHVDFDFVVAERPRYIPGSGPPLAPVTIMPPKDKDGYIVEEIEVFSELRYVVEHHNNPDFRVAVRLPNILSWVSQRDLDDYHKNKYDAEVLEEEERKLPLLEAKEERLKKRAEKLARFNLPSERKSRKRKRLTFGQKLAVGKRTNTSGFGGDRLPGRRRGPGGRNQPVEEDEVTFKSPKQSQHSQQQRSLYAPGIGVANRTVLDTDSDDEDTEMAVRYQSDDGGMFPSNIQLSRAKSKRTTGSKSISSSANASREESQSPSVSDEPLKRSHSSVSVSAGKGAVAAISSREALQIYEDLERKNQKEPLTIAEKYSHTRHNHRSGIFQGAHSHLPPPRQVLAQLDTEDDETVTSEEDEGAAEEYEIRQILEREIRYSDGKPEFWYKIQWLGDWDNTWEPEENIGHNALEEYEANEKNKKRLLGDVYDSDPDSLFVSEGKGKRKGRGKDVQQGQVIDEDDEDDVDD